MYSCPILCASVILMITMSIVTVKENQDNSFRFAYGECRMKYAVVTGGSKNDYDAIATLIVNMTEVMPKLQADYIIFHDGLSEEQRDSLLK